MRCAGKGQWKRGNRADQPVGIHSRDRFSQWFLFFKSSSYSLHQNQPNLKKERKKKRKKEKRKGKREGFPVFRRSSSNGEGEAEPALPEAGVFHSRIVSLRPLWTEVRGYCPPNRLPFLSFPLCSPTPHHSILSQWFLLVIPLHLFSEIFIFNLQYQKMLKHFL